MKPCVIYNFTDDLSLSATEAYISGQQFKQVQKLIHELLQIRVTRKNKCRATRRCAVDRLAMLPVNMEQQRPVRLLLFASLDQRCKQATNSSSKKNNFRVQKPTKPYVGLKGTQSSNGYFWNALIRPGQRLLVCQTISMFVTILSTEIF